MLDANMRRILWGWVQETRSKTAIEAAGWSGCISLPRVLTIGKDSELQMEVAPDVESLRAKSVSIQQKRDSNELDIALQEAVIQGRAGAIRCTFKVGESSFGLDLRLGSRDGISLLAVDYIGVDVQPMLTVGDRAVPLSPNRDGVSSFDIWIDGSVIETIVDRRQAITARSYASTSQAGEIHVIWNRRRQLLKCLVVSDVNAISDDRLTT